MLSVAPDTVVTTAATPVTINVLANDTGTGLTITSFSNPANGSLVFNGDKSFTYTPAAGFLGNDTFSYTVRDAQGTPATAEVTISVLPNGGATVATDDYVEVVEGGGVVVPVLANDMAAGGGALQIIAVSSPGHGVVNVLSNQSIRYVPQTGFVGIDSFTYTVLDEQGATASATVTVKVVAENSAPIAVNDVFSVVADTTTVLAVLTNDSDPNGGPLQIVGFTMPSHGSLLFNTADKTFSYTPAAGYEGPDQFTYTVRDNRGASASASVTLTIARVNESPVAVDDQVTTETGVPVTIDVLANDSLPAGQQINIIAVTLPFRGKLDFNPDKTLTYTPNLGFVGTDDFTYTIGNGKGGTAKATVMIEVTTALPSEWQPTPSPELTATINALEAGAGGYIFVPQAGGLRTINASREAVGNGDPIGFWPDVLSSQTGLTADGDGRPTWDDSESAIRFVQPAESKGRALFFPENIVATKWHLVFCMKSSDNEKFLSQSVLQIPAMRVLTNWQGNYDLQVQVISGGVNFHTVKAGPITDYTLVEIRRDGNTLQTRTNGQNWTTHNVIGWSNFAAADGDPNASMVGRASYTDNNFPDFVSWSGLIGGVVMALDVWLEGDDNEAARRVVTAGRTLADLDPTEATAPPVPSPSGDEPGSTGTATVTVSNYNQLASAINAAGPGTIIELANGTYSGACLIVSKSGTPENPIVIRAANILGATVPNAFDLTGSNIVVRGINFAGNQSNTYRMEIGGQNNQLWRSRFLFYGGFQLRLKSAPGNVTSSGTRIMYCEWTSTAPTDHYQSSTRCIHSLRDVGSQGASNNTEDARNVEIGYCYLHDLPSKPPGESYSFRNRGGIVNGTASRDVLRSVKWNVHHCLLQNAGSHRFGAYKTDITYEYCTIIGQAASGSPSSSDFDLRQGNRHTMRGCWAEGTRNPSFEIHGADHKLISCKVVNGGVAEVFAGNQEAGVNVDGYPRSDRVKFTACEMGVLVGRVWTTNPAMSLPARDTRLENHTGNVSLNGSNQTGTVQTGAMTETPVTPIKITPAMVGPLASL